MKRLAAIVAILTLVGVAAWLWPGRSADDGAFLGYVEGGILYIGPNEEERIASLAVDAGSVVKKGEPLFAMETPLLARQRDAAQARIAEVEAQVENLRAAMNRPEQIAVFQATVERAEAALNLSRSDFQRQKKLFAEGHVAKAALDRAAMAQSRDEATLKEAQRQVEVARMGSRSHEIDAAEQNLKQARFQLDQIKIRIARQSVTAPADGAVQDIFFRPGEVVKAAQPVLSLLPPENRKVRFYAPQPRLSGLRLGERVKVSCDGCADNIAARITFMSGREEFTPPVIFSDAERAKLVFKVQARLEGAGRDLPLGLPVKVTPWPEEGAAK